MLDVSSKSIIITNVTSSVARSTTTSPSIHATYLVSVSSHYSVSELQSQLTIAGNNGIFDMQLNIFAKDFGAVKFLTATTGTINFLSNSPTAAPIITQAEGSVSRSTISEAGFIGILAAITVVCSAGLITAFYFIRGHYISDNTDCEWPCCPKPRLRSRPLSSQRTSAYSPSTSPRIISRATSLDRIASPEQFRPSKDWVNHWKARSERKRATAASGPAIRVANITDVTVGIDSDVEDIPVYPRMASQVDFLNPTLSPELRARHSTKSPSSLTPLTPLQSSQFRRRDKL